MSEAVFFRLLSSDDKSAALAEAGATVREGRMLNPVVHIVDPASFRQVPGSPFAYWVPATIRAKFVDYPGFEADCRSVRLGLSTKNDTRFVRAFWEVPPSGIGRERKWATYANGGSFSPFYCPYPAVVLAESKFSELIAYLLEKFCGEPLS